MPVIITFSVDDNDDESDFCDDSCTHWSIHLNGVTRDERMEEIIIWEEKVGMNQLNDHCIIRGNFTH